MKISTITEGKVVATIKPSATLTELLKELKDRHIGALVVSDDGKRIDGIVSERDVVRSMAANMEGLSSLTVRELMTPNVLTCTADQTVAEILALMTNNRVRHMPVVNAHKELISIVSIGDLVKSHISDLDSERSALRDYINQQ